MKEKNLPDDIRSKSLDDLTEEVDKIIEQLEKTNNLENSIDQYNKLIKLNNFIETDRFFIFLYSSFFISTHRPNLYFYLRDLPLR